MNYKNNDTAKNTKTSGVMKKLQATGREKTNREGFAYDASIRNIHEGNNSRCMASLKISCLAY